MFNNSLQRNDCSTSQFMQKKEWVQPRILYRAVSQIECVKANQLEKTLLPLENFTLYKKNQSSMIPQYECGKLLKAKLKPIGLIQPHDFPTNLNESKTVKNVNCPITNNQDILPKTPQLPQHSSQNNLQSQQQKQQEYFDKLSTQQKDHIMGLNSILNLIQPTNQITRHNSRILRRKQTKETVDTLSDQYSSEQQCHLKYKSQPNQNQEDDMEFDLRKIELSTRKNQKPQTSDNIQILYKRNNTEQEDMMQCTFGKMRGFSKNCKFPRDVFFGNVSKAKRQFQRN